MGELVTGRVVRMPPRNTRVTPTVGVPVSLTSPTGPMPATFRASSTSSWKRGASSRARGRPGGSPLPRTRRETISMKVMAEAQRT